MLIVERIVLETIRMRLKEPFRISSGVQDERRIVLVRLQADGAEGIGECVAGESPNYSYETIDTALYVLQRHLAPAVLGLEFPTARELAEVLKHTVKGHPMARAALEMAAWHAEALVRDAPLARLLGGRAEQVPVGVSIGLQPSIDDLLARIQDFVDQGYARVKLKITRGHDIEMIRQVRDAFPELPLQVDANTAYDSETDIDHLRRLDACGLLMIEQPFGDDDLIGHAKLQQVMETPICLDESITSVGSCRSALRLGAASIVNIKPGRVGGLAESVAIHDACAAEGVPVWCGGMLESGIGRAYNLALASLPDFRYPGDISASDRYWQRDVVDPPFTLGAGGTMAVPGTAGLGVHVDEDYLDTIRVDQVILERR